MNTPGDGFVASFDGPVRVIRCAQGVIEANGNLCLQIGARLDPTPWGSIGPSGSTERTRMAWSDGRFQLL
jgi:hypothetical protein